MQSLRQAVFSWILENQDHLTKFCVLRALTTKRPAEVAFQLLDVFLMFGAPQILQSDNGVEFGAKVITELKVLWPQQDTKVGLSSSSIPTEILERLQSEEDLHADLGENLRNDNTSDNETLGK